MLNSSALTQLKQLKQDIRNANPPLKGIVKGTSKRFGFVIKEGSNEQYLLPQAEMNRVFPGDTIIFKLEKPKTADEKPVARIEKHIDSTLDTFFGKVQIKNNQFFVAPDLKQVNRWIFIPNKFRKGLSEGDLVSAKISQHPFANEGRAQASILARIGHPKDPYIEHKQSLAKFSIREREWKPEEIEAIRQTAEKTLEEAIPHRSDLTAETFITIDGANTQDLDDALAIEKKDKGWLLKVAIADVDTFVGEQTPLDKIAAHQASTVYLPGQKISMLPDILSSEICSLKALTNRLALVCFLSIDDTGNIAHVDFKEAVIHSKGKLAYEEVDRFLSGTSKGFTPEINDTLKALQQLSIARQDYRRTHAVPSEEYFDFRYQLDEQGKIIHIERSERNQAQKMVEECMLACNYAAADFLKEQHGGALYLSHNGFKEDQKPGVKKLFNHHFPDVDVEEIYQLSGYLKFLAQLDEDRAGLPVREVLRKKMHRSILSTEATPHFGLGFAAYTTTTSPIRKYNDLLVQRYIKATIKNQPFSPLTEDALNQLNHLVLSVREAQKDCEMALKCTYLRKFRDKPLEGYVSAINHRFVSIYLTDFDLHGIIPVKTLSDAAKFKQESLQLVLSDKETLQLKQPVTVIIDAIDNDNRTVRLKRAEETDEHAQSMETT